MTDKKKLCFKDTDLSKSFSIIRLPLALLVVYIHIGANFDFLRTADYSLFSGHGLSNVVVLMMQHVFAVLAVPAFFYMSGFLFFVSMTEWSWEKYKRKMLNRFFTLLMPYIIWNVIAVMLSNESCWEVLNFHSYWDCIKWDADCYNWLGLSMASSGPADMPLWFIRDLMCMTLVSPLLFYTLKKVGALFLVFIVGLIITDTYPYLPGLSSKSVMFFSMGGYMALKNIDIMPMWNSHKKTVCSLFFCMMVLYSYYGGGNSIYVKILEELYIMLGVFCVLFGGVCVSKISCLKFMEDLGRSSFFVYALHGLIIGGVMNTLYDLMPGQGLVKFMPSFLFTPVVIVLLSLAIYGAGMRYAPGLFGVIVGKK